MAMALKQPKQENLWNQFVNTIEPKPVFDEAAKAGHGKKVKSYFSSNLKRLF